MNYNDYTGITGNIAKFSLGFVSILFDIIFMIQHYILYVLFVDLFIIQYQRCVDDGG